MVIRKSLLYISIAFFVLIVGGGVLLATLSTSKGLNTIRQATEWGGNRFLNGTLSIGEISGNLWNQLIIHDLSMSLPDSLGGYEVIGADEVWVSFSYWNMLTQGSVMTAVVINQPRVLYRENIGAKQWDSVGILLGLDQEESPGGLPGWRPPLYIPQFHITEGQFLYEDPTGSISLQAQQFSVDGRILDIGHFTGDIKAHNVSFDFPSYQDSVSTIYANIEFEDDSLIIHKLSSEATIAPALSFRAYGVISSIAERQISLTLAAQGDAGSIGRIIGSDTTLEGDFQVNGTLSNTLSDPLFKARLIAPVLQTDIGQVTQVALDFQYTSDVLFVEQYSGQTEAGWVSGYGKLDVSGPREQYDFRIAPSHIIIQDLPVELFDNTLDIKGRVTLEMELSGEGFEKPLLNSTVNISAPLLDVAGTTLENFSSSTQYDRNTIIIDARTPTSTITASGKLLTNGDADMVADIKIPDLQSFFNVADNSVSGAAEMTAEIKGRLSAPSVFLSGQIEALEYTDIPLGDLQLTGTLDADQVAHIEAHLDTNKAHLMVDIDLEGEHKLFGELDLRDVHLNDYIEPDQSLGLDAIIEVDGLIEGTLTRPVFRGEGLVNNLILRGENLGDASLAVTLEERDLSFTVVTPDFAVLSDGIVNLNDGYPFDIRLDIKRANLSPLLAILAKRKIDEQTGVFSGQLEAIGFAEYPDLSTVNIKLDSLIMTMGDRELYFAAPSTIRMDRQMVTVDRLELTGDFGYILVNGIASLKPEGLVDLEALLEEVQFDFLSPFFLTEGNIEGTANGVFSLKGSPDAPVLDGMFSTSDVQYALDGRVNELGTVSFSVFYDDQMLRIPDLSLNTPLGASSATITYPTDLSWGGETKPVVNEVFTASLIMDHLAVRPLREFIPTIPHDLDGRVNGRIDLTGPAGQPEEMSGIVELDSLFLFGLHHELVSEDSLHLRFNSGFVDVDTISVVLRQLNNPSRELGRLNVGGRLAFRSRNGHPEESDFVANGQDITMEAMLALFGRDLPITGVFNGHLEIFGPTALQTVDTQFNFGQITYNEASADSLSARFVYEYGDLIIHDFQLWANEKTLVAYGTVPFSSDNTADSPIQTNNMAITVEGDEIDLSFLSGIFYDLERIQGKADIQLTVGGTPFAPKSVGNMVIQDAEIQFRDIDPPFKTSEMHFAIDGDQFLLQPVEIKTGRGSFDLESKLLRKNIGLDKFEAKAILHDMEFELIGSAKLTANGEVSLTGDAERGLITGAGLSVNGTVTHPLDLGDLILGVGIIRPQTPPDPILERIALDVEVDIPRLQIRNNVADMDVEGGLAFSGNVQNPIITGNASAIDNGTIVYLDTKFDVETGRLEFLNRTPLESFDALIDDPVTLLDPEMTIQAKAERVRDIYGGEYDVTMQLSGRAATQPNLQLTAVPMDEDGVDVRGQATLAGPQVVSLLTFGLSEMDVGAQVFAGVGNRALLMATGNQAEKLLKLDEVRIEGDLLNSTDTGTPAQITISKRINRRTEVTFTRLFDSSEYKLRVGYQLSNFLYIETFTDQISERPQNGFDLKVKFRFR